MQRFGEDITSTLPLTTRKTGCNSPSINMTRCSGVNHCSFIFSEDCPGSESFGQGNLTIKYACASGTQSNGRACWNIP
ncbi:hypothetical protein NQ317_008541 [Molorchus minor]|uniref:SUEL-type lectin domain-containing protein n=1 Tax=Molorchus minor TaxID=1323400 RepID=A0ABQ9J2G6_9CUCU|nr:hypothetical protein NQ317_008541 [Molorchus minor]